MFEVGDSVIYYGYKGDGSKTIGVVVDISTISTGLIEIYWFNGVQGPARIEMIKKTTSLNGMEKYVSI
jgi:hypothetical protein